MTFVGSLPPRSIETTSTKPAMPSRERLCWSFPISHFYDHPYSQQDEFDKGESVDVEEFLAVSTSRLFTLTPTDVFTTNSDRGNLSDITATPFVLATQSTVEFPACWAEHPSLFVAPAAEPDPAKRALLVVRWYLTCLKNQQYGGRNEKDGVKPLNAFFGEVFPALCD